MSTIIVEAEHQSAEAALLLYLRIWLLHMAFGMSTRCLICTDLWPGHAIAKSVLCSDGLCPGFVEALPDAYIVSARNEADSLSRPARKPSLVVAVLTKTLRRSHSCPQLNPGLPGQ